MDEMTKAVFVESKYTEEQLGRLESFINKKKTKAGGAFKPIPFKGIDKNGKPFKYINKSLKRKYRRNIKDAKLNTASLLFTLSSQEYVNCLLVKDP